MKKKNLEMGIIMKKVFLYLYPIKEYTSMFLFHDDNLYDKWKVKRPLPILNECIEKRYRDLKNVNLAYIVEDGQKIYIPKKEDKIIYTDILFLDNSAIDEFGNTKKNFIPKYPNLPLLIKQLGNIEELVIGGYHSSDCVKRVEEVAIKMGINTMIDFDLTDLFFGLYKQEDYFTIEQFNPNKYMEYLQIEKYEEENNQIKL